MIANMMEAGDNERCKMFFNCFIRWGKRRLAKFEWVTANLRFWKFNVLLPGVGSCSVNVCAQTINLNDLVKYENFLVDGFPPTSQKLSLEKMVSDD